MNVEVPMLTNDMVRQRPPSLAHSGRDEDGRCYSRWLNKLLSCNSRYKNKLLNKPLCSWVFRHLHARCHGVHVDGSCMHGPEVSSRTGPPNCRLWLTLTDQGYYRVIKLVTLNVRRFQISTIIWRRLSRIERRQVFFVGVEMRNDRVFCDIFGVVEKQRLIQ